MGRLSPKEPLHMDRVSSEGCSTFIVTKGDIQKSTIPLTILFFFSALVNQIAEIDHFMQKLTQV